MLLLFLGFINGHPQVNTLPVGHRCCLGVCGNCFLASNGDWYPHSMPGHETGDKPKLRLRLTWTLAHIQICTLYSILYITERQSRKDIASSRTSHHTTDLPPKRSFTAKCRSIHSYWDNSEVAAWHFLQPQLSGHSQASGRKSGENPSHHGVELVISLRRSGMTKLCNDQDQKHATELETTKTTRKRTISTSSSGLWSKLRSM